MLVDRSIDADRTAGVLERLAAAQGAPQPVRCDNGPELTAHGSETGVASAAAALPKSSRERRGRTPTSTTGLMASTAQQENQAEDITPTSARDHRSQ
jgi:hypothetical protein